MGGRGCGQPSPFSAETVGKRALAEVSAMASGLTMSELKARKLSGTHADRHVGPEVVGECSWPSEDIDALGGWASPSSEAPDGRAGRKPAVRFGRRRRLSSRVASYTALGPSFRR